MRNHWWWRPGWKLGRSFYTWHITFGGKSDVRALADSYVPLLANLPVLDRVPVRWLHLTVQGLGFTDEIDRTDVDAIVQATEHRLAELQPFTATIGPPQVDPETIHMPVQPVEPLRRLRAVTRGAIGDVWGDQNVPEMAEGWRPHVTLGYSNAAGPAEPITEALATQQAQTVEVEIAAVSLINLNRDNKAYEWVDVATVRLGNTG
ncbi:MAG: 2'-5' RNA ligase family protein [Sciscionella sp.]